MASMSLWRPSKIYNQQINKLEDPHARLKHYIKPPSRLCNYWIGFVAAQPTNARLDLDWGKFGGQVKALGSLWCSLIRFKAVFFGRAVHRQNWT